MKINLSSAFGIPPIKPETVAKIQSTGVNMDSTPLVIYHANCADGFGAAWVVRKFYKEQGIECEFHEGVYSSPPPNVLGRDVVIVDFSYKRLVMECILTDCRSLTWIDHHKSAIDQMEGFPNKDNEEKEFFRETNLDHSGAMLAWHYYFGKIGRDTDAKEPPQLLKHIEDRDLWKFKLPGTEEIQMNLFSYPYDFALWDGFMEMQSEELFSFKQSGNAIVRKHFKDIREFSNVSVRWITLAGVDMPVVNVPYMWGSDAAHILAEGAANKCAGYYYDTASGRIFGLRSIDDRDVAVIAQKYGGGGHKNAAGFKLSYKEALEIEMNSKTQCGVGVDKIINEFIGGLID